MLILLLFVSLFFYSSACFSVLCESFMFMLMLFLLISNYSGLYWFFYGASLDKLSLLLMVLLIWLLVIMFLMSVKYYKQKNFYSYKVSLLLLGVFLFLSFLFKDMLGFYMVFELSLFPLMFVIFGWGYQVERIQATFYLMMYTIVGSLPLLVVFLFFFTSVNLVWLSFMFSLNFSGTLFMSYINFLVCFSLLIKLPMYGLHLWLPKAHVEAPVAGSMILAAVLLKLSAYGFYRMLFFLSGLIGKVHWLMSSLIYGAVVSSVIALRQTDMKSLVAYSSISHMGIMMAGLVCFSSISSMGTFIILLSHGFCSSALFYLVNFHYERSYSRQILLSSGQMNFFSHMAIWWFLFLIINFSAPPFLSLLGEMLVMVELTYISLMFMFLLMLTSFMVAAFCLFLYSSIFHGKVSSQWVFFSDVGLQHLVLLYHIVPSILFILKPEVLWF